MDTTGDFSTFASLVQNAAHMQEEQQLQQQSQFSPMSPHDQIGLSDNELNLTMEDQQQQQHEAGKAKKQKKPTATRKQSISKLGMTVAAAFAEKYLQDNLELYPNAHVSRERLYEQYCVHCHQCSHLPLNSASFGKAIRNVFPTVATRRLGTRGNSKYHYFGIKEVGDDNPMVAMKPPAKRGRSSNFSAASGKTVKSSVQRMSIVDLNQQQQLEPTMFHFEQQQQQQDGERQFRDAPSDQFVRDVLHLNDIEVAKIPQLEHMDLAVVDMFLHQLRMHCELMLKTGLQGRFDDCAALTVEFWRRWSTDAPMIYQNGQLSRIVAEWDAQVYQAMLTIFLPDILGPGDQPMVAELRNYSMHLPTVLIDALPQNQSPMFAEKARVAQDFGKIVGQYFHLNNLAMSCAAITQQEALVKSMVQVWDGLDFDAICQQALYICPNGVDALQRTKNSFRERLLGGAHISQWAEWIFGMTEQFLPTNQQTFDEFMFVAQQYIIRWSYVSSLLMRDICDNDKEIFGAYHLLRLFCDEYVKYLVDCKLDEKRRHFENEWSLQSQQQQHQFASGHNQPQSMYVQYGMTNSSADFSTQPHQDPVKHLEFSISNASLPHLVPGVSGSLPQMSDFSNSGYFHSDAMNGQEQTGVHHASAMGANAAHDEEQAVMNEQVTVKQPVQNSTSIDQAVVETEQH